MENSRDKHLSFRARIWRIFKWALILIPLGFALSFTIGRTRVHLKVKKERDAVRAQKLPTSGAEINTWIPPVPDEKNGALILNRAFSWFKDFNDRRSNIVGNVHVLYTNTWPSEVTSTVEQFVATNAVALDLVGQAMHFDRFHFPVDYSDGFNTLLPHLAKMKGAAIRLSLQTALEAERGRNDRWPELLQRQIQLSEALNEDPTMIGLQVRYSTLAIAFLTAQFCLNKSAPSPEQCLQIQKAFTHAADTNLFAHALIAERAITMPLFHMGFSEVTRMTHDDPIPRGAERGTNSGILLPLVDYFARDEYFYLKVMDMTIKAAQEPPICNLCLTNAFDFAVAHAKKEKLMICGMMFPTIAKIPLKDAKCEIGARIAATAFAIERFRLENYRIPSDLEELVPEFLAEVPTDPFDDEDIRYVKMDRGYQLYSIDSDCVDDHGRVALPDRKSTDHSTYDLTFTVLR